MGLQFEFLRGLLPHTSIRPVAENEPCCKCGAVCVGIAGVNNTTFPNRLYHWGSQHQPLMLSIIVKVRSPTTPPPPPLMLCIYKFRVASFPGPTQLSITYSTAKSWAGPWNKVRDLKLLKQE